MTERIHLHCKTSIYRGSKQMLPTK